MCCFLEAYKIFLSFSFFRITNCDWTSPLKSRKKNRDLKMGLIGDLSERGITGDIAIPWSYFTLLIVLIVVRAPSPAPTFKWRPEFPPTAYQIKFLPTGCPEPQRWQPRRRNVAVAAYLCTCGWHGILWPAWDMAWRNTSSNICHDLIEELEPRVSWWECCYWDFAGGFLSASFAHDNESEACMRLWFSFSGG